MSITEIRSASFFPGVSVTDGQVNIAVEVIEIIQAFSPEGLYAGEGFAGERGD